VPVAWKMPLSLPKVAPSTGAHAPQQAYWKNIMADSIIRKRNFADLFSSMAGISTVRQENPSSLSKKTLWHLIQKKMTR
jgi:hypothetical protein